MTVDFGTKKAITKAAVDLRKKHDALDWAAPVDALIEREGLAQGRWSPFRDKWSLASVIRAVGKKVKALISLKENVILLSDDIHHAREAFAKGHELGHGTLEWHRQILWVCDEHDLSPKTQAQLEWEANTFSSEIILPEPLLKKVYAQYPTSMDTVLQLRSLSGASIEMCAIAFAQHHPRKCLLLILQEEKDADGKPELKLIKKVVSESAAKSRLGALMNAQRFSSEHVLYQQSRGSDVSTGQMHFVDDPLKNYKISVLNNSFRVLALMFEE